MDAKRHPDYPEEKAYHGQMLGFIDRGIGGTFLFREFRTLRRLHGWPELDQGDLVRVLASNLLG
ncbi:MAG: hypothetical protein HGA45_36515 [Chloroflexales bacterium]|nr:hypothetical protein [Chloroflexales bacterium]